jgi:2',3'-cyclic-nucleotide 2'-phosphodiesterase/3'-nucleotidase
MTSEDISYQIDVTQPPGKRIKNLQYRGKPVMAGREFLVATNNYRASGGGDFPGLDGSKTVVAAPDTNRDVLIAFIKKTHKLTRAAFAHASWRFAKVKTAGPVVFRSAPRMLELAQQAGLNNLSELRAVDGLGPGFALYQIDLSK